MNNGEWTCPLCGATLDAGEKCDCQNEKGPPIRVRPIISKISITQKRRFEKHD